MCVCLSVCVLLGESCVKSIHALLNGILSPFLFLSVPLVFPFSLTYSHSLTVRLSPSSGYSVSLFFSLLWFISFSCATFLLSCLSWPYVCDVIQDKEAKLAWNVRLSERVREDRWERVKYSETEGMQKTLKVMKMSEQ